MQWQFENRCSIIIKEDSTLNDSRNYFISSIAWIRDSYFRYILEPAEVKSAIHRELINRTGLYPELKSEYNKIEKLYNSIDQYNIEHNEKILTEALKLIANIKIDDFIEKWREATIKSRNNRYIIELNSLIQNYFDGNSK